MRYLPLTSCERQDMLQKIGVSDIDALFSDIPAHLLWRDSLPLPSHQSELAVGRLMEALAQRNRPASAQPFFIGGGAYRHHIPASVDHIIQRSEFLTSYTPYQPEIAQGTLQYLFEFQTQVAALTGMEVANASMYDGSTATNEAVLMAHRLTGRKKALLSGGLHPHYAEVIKGLAPHIQAEVVSLPKDIYGTEEVLEHLEEQLSCLVVQTPDVFGNVRDLTPIAKACQAHGILLIAVFNEVISLGLLRSPGEMGADIVVGEGQSLGNSLSFGGPYVGLFATRERYMRQMPGRLCGQTYDKAGRRAFVLTLSAREQHIRREKATSNICTNSGLCSLAFTIHLSLLGQEGLKTLALINHSRAVALADLLSDIPGVQVLNKTFFNEFMLLLPKNATDCVEKMVQKGVLAGIPLARFWPQDEHVQSLLLVANTEMNTTEDQQIFVQTLKEVLSG